MLVDISKLNVVNNLFKCYIYRYLIVFVAWRTHFRTTFQLNMALCAFYQQHESVCNCMWALNVMFNARFVSSRVEEMGALMANLEKANQVSAVPSSQPLIETPRRQDNHLRNQALSLIRRPCSPSSSPTTLLVLALAGPWLAGTLSHGAVRAAEDRRERDGCWETRAMWRMRRAVSYLIALIASFFSTVICFFSLRQQLLDKWFENESLISRPSVTEQVNSLRRKCLQVNTHLSRTLFYMRMLRGTCKSALIGLSRAFLLRSAWLLIWFWISGNVWPWSVLMLQLPSQDFSARCPKPEQSAIHMAEKTLRLQGAYVLCITFYELLLC